jgi:hypothetical protein
MYLKNVPRVVVQACNPSIQEMEAERS